MPKSNRVLIIDDETDLCLLLKDYFVRKNYEVFLAHTLNEGLVLINSVRPDILFIDNNMPDGLGWALAPQLAANYPSMYTILISAFHPEEPIMPDKVQYRVIEKPISLADLDKQFADL